MREKKQSNIAYRKLHTYLGRGVSLLVLGILFFCPSSEIIATSIGPLPLDNYEVMTDTIPVKDNKGDFINDPNNNPFDITPSNVTQTVEYDPNTGKYILIEKIGEEYYKIPSYMTFQEYLAWKKKQDEKEYFAKLSGVSLKKKGKSGLNDVMDDIDVSSQLIDRLFGGTEVNIQPQGQVDVTLQSRYSKTTGNQAFQPVQFNPIDPNVAIKVSVDGNIGTKLNLGFNYDTQSSFDFDRKIKLAYDTEAFGEDDIIKTIEAGNVSLPLRGNLIQGAQGLFGIKTQLQFGNLYLTGLLSQQQSEQKSITISNGAATQEFEITVDQYDENRHFFLSHFHRDNYEIALERLPQINSAFRLADIEVWVSNNRVLQNNVQNTTSIVAISDIGEHDLEEFDATNPAFRARYGPNPSTPSTQAMIHTIDGEVINDVLPENSNNKIWSDLIVQNSEIDSRSEASSILSSEGLVQGKDFEVFEGRRLSSSEFTYNEQLGFISLNVRLRPNQVLAVSYNYYYTGLCEEPQTPLKVGQLSTNSAKYTSTGRTQGAEQDSLKSNKVVFAKLLKSSTQPTNIPSYDLMMKNVYSLGATLQDPDEFSFDIYFEDDSEGTFKKFLPEYDLRFTPLLNLFNLDRLNKFNDPQPDGIFDYVPGVTVIPRSGSVVFPVLEPFGSDLARLVRKELKSDPTKADQVAAIVDERYSFKSLYDQSITSARQQLEDNKFRMKGFVKSSTSGEINLGPFTRDQSVRVRAGGIELIEGSDYEIDYSLGRLRIINPSYLQQGTPITVSFEDQTLFSLQQKNMIGLRADYNISKKAKIGATLLNLSERPFTTKVNIGNDPINNTIYGLDFSYSSEAPEITKLVDKLPFYSTNAPSAVNFFAEAAYLRPGYSNAIGVLDKDSTFLSVVSIDDFEGAINGIQLGGFNTSAWRLASTPREFVESTRSNDLAYGANRARLSWFTVDRAAIGQADEASIKNAYTRIIDQRELFPQRGVQIGQTELITFNLDFRPDERGPYNFDLPGGIGGVSAGIDTEKSIEEGDVRLNRPDSRWGGIMRAFQNTDFEAANYEFIEFWMLNPYMERPDGEKHDPTERGELVIQLGNVSEDILKDGSQLYENALPRDPSQDTKVRKTTWGRTTESIPFVNGFDREKGENQDLGFDGLTDSLERIRYKEYLSSLSDAGLNFADILSDPSSDNFADLDEITDKSLLEQYKKISNPQGNAPLGEARNTRIFRGNRLPDSEDMNNNRTLDNSEQYYSYEIPLYFSGNAGSDVGELDQNAASKYITDTVTVRANGGDEEIWYRFRVPIDKPDATTGITGFRSIQFMRMYLKGFKTPKTLRLAEFQLLRNQWRKNSSCASDQAKASFTVDEVGLQENGQRSPFPYKKPPRIKQERLQSTTANIIQDEKSMSLKFEDMARTCRIGVNKLARLDLTQYKKLELFVHGESMDGLKDGDLKAYVKLGKDIQNNYYEYEIPIILSKEEDNRESVDNIWPVDNVISLPLELLVDAKEARLKGSKNAVGEYVVETEEPGKLIRIKGTPSLAKIKIVEIGVKNATERAVTGEVWFNELRLLGLNQKPALAGEARLHVQLADLGELNLSGTYSGIGWGALDQNLSERNRSEIVQYDAAASLALDKFFPEKWGLSIPFYAQYTSNVTNYQYEPYEGDMTPDEKIAALRQRETEYPEQRDSIEREIVDVRDRSREKTTIKSYNFTNVKKNSTGTAKPWSPSNFSVSYAYTETTTSNPVIAEDKTKEYNASLDYNYTRRAKYIQPFKSIKSKHLKLVKEINFNLLPTSFTFGTDINRRHNSRRYRLPMTPIFQFDDRRFFWNRNYGLNWDFTKSLKLNFKAKMQAVVDELRQAGVAATPQSRPYYNEFYEKVDFNGRDTLLVVNDYRNENLRRLGRSKNYNHNFSVSYNLPIRYLPYMDWVTARAEYKADYGWIAGSRVRIDNDNNLLGNTIQNNQTRSISATLSFDRLYRKSKYLNDIYRGKKSKSSRRRSQKKTKTATAKGTKTKDKSRKKQSTGPSAAEMVLLRPLLLIRNVKLNYREDFGTVVPGFMEEARLLGLSSGFDAPGWGFVLGGQPDLSTWLPTDVNSTRGTWFNPSNNFNGIISQNMKQSLDVKIALEPIKDLDIDIDFKKSYALDHSEQLKIIKDDNKFTNGFFFDMGSYNFSHLGLNTLFKNSDDLYNQFRDTREDVSKLLAEKAGIVERHDNPDFKDFYYKGYGPENPDVTIPSFLAAYRGKSAAALVENSLINQVSKRTFLPSPNWSIKYDGLSRMEMFRDVISSFSIRHAYRGLTTVGSYSTNILFDKDNPFDLTNSTNDNYLSEFNIPAMRVVDQFAPLIGFALKLKNEMTFEGGYNKNRTLNLTQLNLSESFSNELNFSFGYTIKNLKSSDKRKGRSKRTQRDSKRDGLTGRVLNSKVDRSRGKTIRMNLDFSFADNGEKIYRLGQNTDPETTRGTRSVIINPSVDYDINKNLTMRFFVNYNNTISKNTIAVDRLDIRAGATAQLKIN